MTVKPEAAPQRSQRKAIVRLPPELLVRQQERFPDHCEPNTVVALFALRALAQRINDRTNAALAPLGLNAAKYNHLVVLYMTPSQMLTLSEISDLIHTTNASVSATIDGLERDGLVRRTPNPNDRRSMVVRLTPRGRKRVEEAVPVRYDDTEVGMGVLSLDERAQLASLLLRISAGFDSES
jgi:DNA-binding MarR family transcriptional regulator